MQQVKLIFENSPWWLIICLAAGFIYAFLLYRQPVQWAASTRKLLFAARWLVVFVIAALLVNPMVRYLSTNIDKPVFVLAVDNSSSLRMVNEGKNQEAVNNLIAQVRSAMADKSVDLEISTFNGALKPDSNVRFDVKSTDLTQLLQQVESQVENRPVAGVALISDGIFNQGSSPLFPNFSFPIHTLGVGDTTIRRDVSVAGLAYNRTVYKGFKFPVKAEIRHNDFGGREIEVLLKNGNNILARKNITLQAGKSLSQVEFLVDAKETGFQKLDVQILPVEGEFTLANNLRTAFVEVVENKDKILLVAPAPHPDLKAIKAALDNEDNLEVVLHIPGVNSYVPAAYNLVIAHQAPDLSNSISGLVGELAAKKIPIFYLAGQQTNLNTLAGLLKIAKLQPKGFQTDKVNASVNQAFRLFNVESEWQKNMDRLPPVESPYADLQPLANTEVLFFQKIGSATSPKPLLMLGENEGLKQALFMGEGIWQWRLQEYAQSEQQEVFDGWLKKTVKYLLTRSDGRRFRVFPVVNEVFETERVRFEAAMFNRLFEPLYNIPFNLTLQKEGSKPYQFTFTPTETNSRFDAGFLPPGLYQYTASTNLDGSPEKISGQVLVKELQLEELNTTADFALLRELSAKNGGKFFHLAQADELLELLTKTNYKGTVRSSEELKELVKLKWLLWLIFGLLTLEWVIRKYAGGY
jgi:hypothetical protein